MPVTLIFLIALALFLAALAASGLYLGAVITDRPAPAASPTRGLIRCAVADCNAAGDVWNRHEHRRLCTRHDAQQTAIREGN